MGVLFFYLHRFSTANQFAVAAFGNNIGCPAFFTGIFFPDLIGHNLIPLFLPN
jgi:hypothetical protein